MNYDAVISYLESRRWRSSVFSNLALLVLGAMIAKIITNFVSGEPGFGGFRVSNNQILLISCLVEWNHRFWLVQTHISTQRPRIEVRPKISRSSIFGREWDFCPRFKPQIRHRSTLRNLHRCGGKLHHACSISLSPWPTYAFESQ